MTTILYLQIQETKQVPVDTWNALIFILTSLLTIILGVIAYYQKENTNQSKELVKRVTEMAIDMSSMKANSDNIKSDVTEINADVKEINERIADHEKRITKLEVYK